MKLTLKKAATGTCLGLVLASGSVFAATAPSNAATPAATAARTASSVSRYPALAMSSASEGPLRRLHAL